MNHSEYGQWVEDNEIDLQEEFSDKYSDLFIEFIWADKKRLQAFFDAHREEFERFCNAKYNAYERDAA